MENPSKSRGRPSASKNKTFNKKSFIQYETDLVEDLNDKKSGKQSVSGRLLCLLYKRLSFWSRYAKHIFNGRRYFWKSITELSEEVSYSSKQVSRGLRTLVEMGLIIREKLNKHNWKHTYYYYLPKSTHTAEVEDTASSRSTSREEDRRGGLTSTSTHSRSPSTDQAEASGLTGHPRQHQSAGAGKTTPSGLSSRRAEAVRPKGRGQTNQNVPFISKEKQSISNIHLRDIVEKCMDYGKTGIKPITGRGIGFAT